MRLHRTWGRGRQPATLRRYLPEFRVYAAWQHILEEQGQAAAAEELAMVLAERGNIGPAYAVAKLYLLLDDFPRRREALAGDWADSTPGIVASHSGPSEASGPT
ncbi:hypothetical protein OG607_01365 [Streptomyces sp. NBC_01537]|uniref:hypothetical protein n=1 Tax=Streptomyces sp. NBC_01537 TaxID=2903896 RepID=UPI003868DA2C